MQDIITFTIVGFTILWFIFKQFKSKNGCSSCSGCTSNCSLNNAIKEKREKNLFHILQK